MWATNLNITANSKNNSLKSVLEFTSGIGCDGVLITASTSSKNVINGC